MTFRTKVVCSVVLLLFCARLLDDVSTIAKLSPTYYQHIPASVCWLDGGHFGSLLLLLALPILIAGSAVLSVCSCISCLQDKLSGINHTFQTQHSSGSCIRVRLSSLLHAWNSLACSLPPVTYVTCMHMPTRAIPHARPQQVLPNDCAEKYACLKVTLLKPNTCMPHAQDGATTQSQHVQRSGHRA